MKKSTWFSWKAAVLAPLPVPLLAAGVLATAPSADPIQAFLFFFILAALVSYGVTALLLLPCLWILSHVIRLNVSRTGLLGLLLGLVISLPLGWQSYFASGDNSGPLSGTFLEYLLGHFWTESWIFYIGGAVTAVLYWLLAGARAGSRQGSFIDSSMTGSCEAPSTAPH